MFKKLKRFLIKSPIYFFVISITWVVLHKYIPVPATATMLVVGKPFSYKFDWEPLENMSPNVLLAVIAAEDQKFFEHHGFDLEAIKKAVIVNQSGKKLRGGSTISQQVAKNVFLWQGRSYLRKGLEAYFTFLIELIWSKERILEVYVNVAQTGPTLFGFEEAAESYYKKSAKILSQQEAARIASILPSPAKWSATKPGSYVQKRTRNLVKQMNQLGGKGFLDKNLKETTSSQPAP